MSDEMAYGYPVVDHKPLGLDNYFKENPHVAGMAWGGGENGSDPKSPRVIVANPYNQYMSDPKKRDGLLRIEAARHLMSEKALMIKNLIHDIREDHAKEIEGQ